MIKLFFALFRGAANEASRSVTDRHGLLILKQQIADCAKAVDIARKSVAIAMAQNKQEEEQYQKLVARIEDLEGRTIIALEKGEEKIARDAAEAIAVLEMEQETSKAALEQFQTGIDKLKAQVRGAETRLRELKRGYQLAEATDKTQKMRSVGEVGPSSTLNEAEETLSRLQNRQSNIDNVAIALESMDDPGDAEGVIKRLADAGCGTPLKTSADDVLERLKNKKS